MAKITISTANKMKKNRHYLPTTTLTTCDVAQIFPVNILPTIPGDTFSIDHIQISQSIPTAVKTFGAFHIRTFAFFVPHRVVMPKFEETLARSVDSSLDLGFAKFSLFDLYQAMFGLYVASNEPPTYDLDAEHSPYVTSDATNTDISLTALTLTNHGQGQAFLHLTAKGRLLMKILQGLGYEIPLTIPSSALVSDFLTQQYDVLPLLSFARFFYDFVYPSSYVSQQGFGYLFEGLQGYSTSQWLSKLLDLFFVPMEQDFFTSLWLRPNQKALGSSAIDVTEYRQSLSSSNSLRVKDKTDNDVNFNDMLVRQDSASSVLALSASSLRWLEALSDFVIRNNVGGQRFHEWMKAHFGYVTIPEDSVRSIFLKSWNDTLNFSQVTATSEGFGSTILGDRVAQGNSQGRGKLKFECKEHGFLIYACMIVPSHDYYQGLKPWCRAITSPDDFYTPELDSVDMAPVPFSSVLNSFRLGESEVAIINHPNDAFGFAPRYAEKYKVGWSFLNGDFRLPSRMAGKDAYHTFRNVSYGRSTSNKLALDAQFLQADNQYDRIYAVAPEATEQEQLNDKIETFFLFNTVKYSSQLSIGDSMPLFDKSGRDVTLENGGTQI